MELHIDPKPFADIAKKYEKGLGQLPYAFSRTLNSAAQKTRTGLIEETWPNSIQQRNTSFMKAALTTKGASASKTNLSVTIYDKLGRVDLVAHDAGGTKTPHGARFAIPLKGSVRRGAHGVYAGQTPRAIIASTPARALRLTQRGLFVGEGGRLHLKYSFQPHAYQPADVKFTSDFQRNFARHFEEEFFTNFFKALDTAW